MATKKEKNTDFWIRDLLKAAEIDATYQGSDVIEINEALKSASKKGSGKPGFPEFVAISRDFVLVIENKAEPGFQGKYIHDEDKSTLLMDTNSVMKYAENGALHYALHIVGNTNYKKVFAFGCSGTEEKKLTIRPIFVSPSGYKLMPPVRDFSSFNKENIYKYYDQSVCENKALETIELTAILKRAESLHEDLRNYAQLGDTEKPLVVSAILLALQEPGFGTEKLTGDTAPKKTDGVKVFRALSKHMQRVKVQPSVKKEQVLSQFSIIKTRPILSEFNNILGKSPLRYFAEYLHSQVVTAIYNNSPEDVLGRFYGEFIKYSGGDGQSLGVVLTPKHITELAVELAQVTPTDRVFDPCCGTGGFLIAALYKMLATVDANEKIPADKKKSLKDEIKRENLHGIELRNDMFSIATTNMILRGDGKSNLQCANFLKREANDLRKNGYTVGLMNPPYAQAKKKVTADLAELRFVSHLLDSLADGGRCVVVVPQSAMTGKTNSDKEEKKYLLGHHTLEGVITLQGDTFYGVGTNPCIAVFTAHCKHPDGKLVKFVDFKDDGFEVSRHLGLLETSVAKERKKLLLDCWFQGKQAPSKFIVRSTVKADDEWLHSFYYFNDEIPSDKEFEKAVADYLTFEFNMSSHGRAYLFEERN